MPLLLTLFLLTAALQPLMADEKPFAFGSVRFEANRGQADSGVRYLARARGQQIFLTDTGVVLSPEKGAAVRMAFAGAGTARWMPLGAPSDSISYYIGNDSATWVKGAPVYDRIAWRGVYPGVDVVFYGHADRLEYDLVFAPGADPSQVRLQFAGPARVLGKPDGAIEISSASAVIRQRAPDIYQETASGRRRKVTGRFVLAGADAVRIELGPYRRSRALVVDPVIETATYLGGENDDEIVAMADGFVAGNTRSLAFPANNPTLRRGRDIFVRGTGFVIPGQTTRSTFLGTVVIGGSGDDELAGIAINTTNGVYLAGTTTSADFPATGQSQYKGGLSDGFVAVVSISQFFASLNSAFYVGGSGEDRIHSFAGNGSILALAGVTDSLDLPVGDVPQKTLRGGKDAFYGVIYGSTATYGYLGGSGDDAAYAVTIRPSNRVWIGGETRSPDFPFPEPGLAGPSDAFLTEVSFSSFFSTTPSVTVSSYRIGGSGEDTIRALVATPSTITSGIGGGQVLRPITVDQIGFAGTTTSADLPVRNAAQSRFGGERDGFVGMWDVAASAPRWLTYLGGSGPDEATAIAQNWAGDLYVGGWTRSADLPVVEALQPGSAGGEDGMFAVLDSEGALRHLTYYGGSGDDRIRDVRVIFNSVARVAGSTTSTDLPQRLPWQDRGGRSDGFVADIGTDYFMGPDALILAKDALLSFSVRAGRTAFREPVTYRSSDPSRVRLVYLGRSFDQVTAAPEDNISVEALADTGEVETTVSAPGFTTKRIRVKLYPGVFTPSFNLGTNSLSTWSSPTTLFVLYRAVDPATGQPIGVSLALRPGMPSLVVNWAVSDPSVFELLNASGSTQLHALKPGEARLTLTMEGFRVLQAEQVITAVTPRLLLQPTDEIRLGQDLYANLPLSFGINGFVLSDGYRGTLTARSSDPSRLLLSLVGDQAGRESVSLTMSGRPPGIWAQALAGEGRVQVFLSSSEFDGEIPITITLEPTVVKWGATRFIPAIGTVIDPSLSLTAGGERTPLVFSLQSESGRSGNYRPGAPPITLKLSNSNPRVAELNRLTSTLGVTDENYMLRPVASGASELSLVCSCGAARLANATVHVDVGPAVAVAQAVILPPSVWVGKGLQTFVSFRYSAVDAGVDVLSDDPSAVLVSSSAKAPGSQRLTVQSTPSGEYTFYMQALKSQGETRVRLRFPEGEEKEIKVNLAPSGAGFVGSGSRSIAQGFEGSVRVVAWALDRESGVGIFVQIPQPGPGIVVHFRSEGAPMRFYRDSALLTADSPEAALDFAPLAPVQETTLIAETEGDFTSSLFIGKFKIAGSPISTEAVNIDNILLARDELRTYNLPSSTSQSAMTVTSSDPRRVLVGATAKDAGSASLQSPTPFSTIYIYALAESGSATLRFESPGAAPREVKVALQPLQLSVYGAALPLGGTAEFTMSLNAYGGLRSGAGPYRFNVRSADPAVATVVDAATIELGGASSSTGAKLRITGVAVGTTRLILDGPPDVYILPNPITISVGASQVTIPTYTVGRNLQTATQIDLGASFSNPNGAIVALTSSDPSRLLLSRSSSTPGTASVSVAVPAGDRRTQQVYFQAISEGDVMVGVLSNGVTQPAATVRITPAWLSCGSQAITIAAGSSQAVPCLARFVVDSSTSAQDIAPRPGLDDLTVRFFSTAPDVFTVTPESLTLQGGGNQVTLRAIAPGKGELRITPPPGFGPSPDGSDALSVSVIQPTLATGCPKELVLGKDTQISCVFSLPPGVRVTATSQNPSLLVMSSDAKIAGAAAATVVSTGQDLTFTFQGLASFGTAEVVFSAPGYQDLRTAVALRPSEFFLSSSFSPSNALTLRVGSQATLTVVMRTSFAVATPRAGANIAVDLSTNPVGIVSLDPARVNVNGQPSSGQAQVRGTAVGSTLIRMTAPEGFLISGTPIVVSVVP